MLENSSFSSRTLVWHLCCRVPKTDWDAVWHTD